MVKLTIDGRELEVPAGTLVIRAAEQLGIYIPRFCDHPLLDPLGACRQCLVEIEGQRKQLTACTTTVSEGMVVSTQAASQAARDAQESVLEFLLVNHPLDCPMCDKGGECPLQDQTLKYGPGESRYVDAKRRFTKPIPISPLINLDRERCVLCARCTRFSSQIAGDPLIEFFERGASEQVAVFEEEPFSSAFSGNVTQICPVGALTTSTFRFRARPFDMTTTRSTCTRCASGCAIGVQARRGELVRILAAVDLDVNDEWLCDKGRFGHAYVATPERVTQPLVRKGGELVETSWSEALEVVASRVRAAREAGARIGVLGGEQLLDEDAYALSRFARTVLGTNDVDARVRVGADDEEHLFQALPKTITATNQDIDAARAVLVVGLDAHEESPIVFLRLRKAGRRLGTRVVEVGPMRTALEKSSGEWLATPAGAESAALIALACAIGGEGLDAELRAIVDDPEAISAVERAGIDTAEAARLAEVLEEARGSVVVLAGERLAGSPGALPLAWNLARALGGKFGWVPRRGGARGAVDAGLHPALLPGGRSVRWAPHREEVEQVWGSPVPEAVGRDARAILENAAETAVLFLFGADPVRDFPGITSTSAQFVVACDMFLTASVSQADVVLPAAAGTERAGTATNWEGRRRAVRAATSPAGASQADIEVLAALAAELGHDFPGTLEDLGEEMRALAAEPVEAKLLEVSSVAAPHGDAERSFGLLSYPMLIDSGTLTAGADALTSTGEAPYVVLSYADASSRGIADGTTVRVASAAGEVRAPARISKNLAPGVVFVPARQGDVNAGVLFDAGESVGFVHVEAVE